MRAAALSSRSARNRRWRRWHGKGPDHPHNPSPARERAGCRSRRNPLHVRGGHGSSLPGAPPSPPCTGPAHTARASRVPRDSTAAPAANAPSPTSGSCSRVCEGGRGGQRAHIFESLEAAPPVTLATRSAASSVLSSSSCFIRSALFLLRSSCTLSLAISPVRFRGLCLGPRLRQRVRISSRGGGWVRLGCWAGREAARAPGAVAGARLRRATHRWTLPRVDRVLYQATEYFRRSVR